MKGRDLVCDNPFFVLGISREATRAEIERAGQRLLAELVIGRESARVYLTPLGPCERTPDRVRAALAELRDSRNRLAHEVWSAVDAVAPSPRASLPVDERARDALLALRRR